MLKLPKQICLIVTLVILFAMCSPIIGSLAGLLFISQNVNPQITVMLGAIVGIAIKYYLPIIQEYFNNIFNNMFNLLQQ